MFLMRVIAMGSKSYTRSRLCTKFGGISTSSAWRGLALTSVPEPDVAPRWPEGSAFGPPILLDGLPVRAQKEHCNQVQGPDGRSPKAALPSALYLPKWRHLFNISLISASDNSMYVSKMLIPGLNY
jgi:hypothetical protein